MTAGRLRRAEVVAALSLATDLGTGQPLESGLRAALVAVRLGEVAGADAATVEIVEVDEIPLTYLPSNALRVRVKAAGDLEARNAERGARNKT